MIMVHKQKNQITIKVWDGLVNGVSGLPKGWSYKVVDERTGEDIGTPEEYD